MFVVLKAFTSFILNYTFRVVTNGAFFMFIAFVKLVGLCWGFYDGIREGLVERFGSKNGLEKFEITADGPVKILNVWPLTHIDQQKLNVIQELLTNLVENKSYAPAELVNDAVFLVRPVYVRYQYGLHTYRICLKDLSTNCTERQVASQHRIIDAYVTSDVLKESETSAMGNIDNVDVTRLILEYQGPFHNFYSNVAPVKASDIVNDTDFPKNVDKNNAKLVIVDLFSNLTVIDLADKNGIIVLSDSI
jgi:hypothetical protein